MNKLLRNTLVAAGLAVATQAAAQVTFYEREGFAGRSFTTQQQISNFERFGFNDRASSVVVARDRWEVCEDARFEGRCAVLRPGRYPSLAAMGLNDGVSSVRSIKANARIEDYRYAPAPVVAPALGAAQVTFYEYDAFAGRSFTADQQVGNFERYGFNDRASSVVVIGDRWEVCEDVRFNGRCVVLRPGRYASLAAMGLNDRVSSVRRLTPNTPIDNARYGPAPVVAQAPAQSQVVFYENEGFAGRTFPANQDIGNFSNYGFNDRASSVVVLGGPWEVCEHAGFGGRCMVLRPGRYPSLAAMGLNDRISSVRMVSGNARIEDNRYAPAPVAVYDNRRRDNERVYEATVTSVRAVVGPPEQRCWIEREQVGQSATGNLNIPGAIIGAVIGGVLGHQVGGGRGKDLATVGGAVAGGAVGRQRWPWGQHSASTGRQALRDRTQPGTSRILGCHLQFPGSGVSHASDLAPGAHGDCQRARRTARIVRLYPARVLAPSTQRGLRDSALMACQINLS